MSENLAHLMAIRPLPFRKTTNAKDSKSVSVFLGWKKKIEDLVIKPAMNYFFPATTCSRKNSEQHSRNNLFCSARMKRIPKTDRRQSPRSPCPQPPSSAHIVSHSTQCKKNNMQNGSLKTRSVPSLQISTTMLGSTAIANHGHVCFASAGCLYRKPTATEKFRAGDTCKQRFTDHAPHIQGRYKLAQPSHPKRCQQYRDTEARQYRV